MKKEIKKSIQQIPAKELREFVVQQIGKDKKFQAAFLKHFEDYFTEKESGDAYIEQVEDAFCTTYEDGTKVYVNYTHSDVSTPDGTVPARDYLVIR